MQRIILHILLSTIVNIVVLKTRGMIILYLTTIVTMIDNFYKSCVQWMISLSLLSNIVVLKNKRLDNFVFNDNTDNH